MSEILWNQSILFSLHILPKIIGFFLSRGVKLGSWSRGEDYAQDIIEVVMNIKAFKYSILIITF